MQGTDPAGASVSPLWKIETQIHQDTVEGPSQELGVEPIRRERLLSPRILDQIRSQPGLICLWGRDQV